MARANKMWRTLAVMGAALAALAITTAAFAQAPPTPPHAFFGSPADGAGVTIDGNAAPAGTVVTAWNENGDQVGTATLDAAGLWVIQVDPAMAMSVSFTVDGAATTQSFDVESGAISRVALSVSGAAPPPSDDAVPPPSDDAVPPPSDDAVPPPSEGGTPSGLPNTGTGGLAGSGSSLPILPLALMAAVVLALGGVAVTRRSLR